jgi:starch synthase (maltosyl-transferring)
MPSNTKQAASQPAKSKAGSTSKMPETASKRTDAILKPAEGRARVVIEGVTPQVDGGRFPAKGVVAQDVVVEADVFGDGHDHVRAHLLYRREGDKSWTAEEMTALGNDRWRAQFPVAHVGYYEFTITGDVDHFETWRSDLEKRIIAGQDLELPLKTGALLIDATAKRAKGKDAKQLTAWAKLLRDELSTELALNPAVLEMVSLYPDKTLQTSYEKVLKVWVDRERAGYSSWYELFPRSWSLEPGRHGNFRDVAAQLSYVTEMGFNVLYLPPIHPIGVAYRKGKNNTTEAADGDHGSPWAIGATEGGHTEIHPDLGTLADFEYLLAEVEASGMELAMDIAFQCAPDHPWVKEHPDWFKKRADGSIQYAENPPKKYQDIYPIDFESSDWKALWDALKNVFTFWAEKGVRIFRVDNPHTKAFPFWEWCVAQVKSEYPDALFLAEAFTRPRVMQRLAKLGYSQSYTYFTWRETKAELTAYLTELTTTSVKDYLRPNFWPNTPDILPGILQTGGMPAFKSRLILAGTLSSNYGIYGPAYELGDNTPFRREKSEEYLNSEKYEIKQWNRDDPNSLKPLITLLNRAREENAALQTTNNLTFQTIDNSMLIAYSKATPDESNVVLTIVNLDPYNVQSGFVDLDLDALGLNADERYRVNDALTGNSYEWRGSRNYVELRPDTIPAHILVVEKII